MKFEISCASGDKPEAKIAILEQHWEKQIIHKTLVHDNQGESYSYRTYEWYREGRNHTENEGCLHRETLRNIYTIKLENLDELVNLVSELDCDVIVNRYAGATTGLPLLIVYDDYLE